MICPTLDKVCGGGVPHESIIYIYGGPGLGKTTIALNMVRAMGSGVWVDASGSLHHPYAIREGVEDMTIIDRIPDLDRLLPFIGVTPILVIDDLTAVSDNLARPLQAFIKDAKKLLLGSGTTLVITNQVRECSDGLLPPGGLSYIKHSDLVLRLGPKHSRAGDMLSVETHIIKSVVGPHQGMRVLMFRSGLCRVWDILRHAISLGIVKEVRKALPHTYDYHGVEVKICGKYGDDIIPPIYSDTFQQLYAEVMVRV